MIVRDAIKLIPPHFKPQFVRSALFAFVKGLLNLVSFAMFVPVIFLFLQPDSVMGNQKVVRIAEFFGVVSEFGLIVLFCCTILAVIITKNILLLLINRSQNSTFVEMFRTYSEQLFRSYMERGLLYIKDNNSNTLTNNVCFATYTFVFNIISPVVSIISEAMVILCILLIVGVVNVYVVLVLMVFIVPVFLLYQIIFRNRLVALGRSEYEKRRNQIRIVQESMKGYAEILVNNATSAIFDKYNRELTEHAQVKRQIENSNGLTSGILEVVVMVMLVLLLIASRFMDIDSSLLGVILSIFGFALIKIITSARTIINNYTMIKTSGHTMEIIAEGLDSMANGAVVSNGFVADRLGFEKSIDVRDLRFSYDGHRDVISGLSFSVAKGENVGIRGESGSGKSTLFYMLLGLYKPASGTISVDGQTIEGDKISTWHNRIGYVSQDVFISDSTIAENIAMGCSSEPIDEQRLNYAIRMASLEKFVATLADGVDSHIGEAGSKLSGGLKQRIGIARALYKRADVLFFDEATSSLDAKTEMEIRESIKYLSGSIKDLTILIIAHNESSLADCDRIIDIK